MDQAADLEGRFARYLALPENDVEGRSRLAPSEEDLDQLHALTVHSPDQSSLYQQVNLTRRTDQIFQKEGQANGWTVAQIRQQLERIETRTYSDQGQRIREVEFFRFWPVARYLHRIRKQPNGCFINEIEWDYLMPVDLEQVWQKELERGFEEECILLAQQYPDHELVQEMAFLPPHGITYLIIFKAGNERKEFVMPTALRYKNLINSFVKLYTLEDGRYGREKEIVDDEERAGDATIAGPQSVEMNEGIYGLWKIIQECDLQKVKNIPGYFKKGLRWHGGSAFDLVSTETDSNSRDSDNKRILKERFDRQGGEFDAPCCENDEEGHTTLHDIIRDQSAPTLEAEALFREIVRILPDSTDQQIIQEMVLYGATQQELAHKLGISQSAIAQRWANIKSTLRKLLTE